MKFAITRIFETSQILKTKAGQELSSFIEYISQLQDQLLRLSQNNVTIDDNIKSERKNVIVKNGQTNYQLQIATGTRPSLVLYNTSDASVDVVFLFNWIFDGNKQLINVYLEPNKTLLKPTTVELIIFYK